MNKIKTTFDEKVEETMLGPVWARAKYSEKYPELLNDQKAIEVVNKIEYDFSKIEEYLEDWRGLGLMARAKNFDLAIRKYIKNNPEATIINLGAGLDTTFYRVDNGNIIWYDLDLPSAISYRQKILHESERNKFISRSALDYSWFNDIKFDLDRGVFFIAGGLVYYFKKEEVSSLFVEMAKTFKGGEIIFDATSKLATKIINRRAKKSGEDDFRLDFSVGNPEKIFPNWSDKIEVKDWYTIWSKITVNPDWGKKIIKAIKRSERVKAAKIIHLRFKN